jgi:sulfur carrier protein
MNITINGKIQQSTQGTNLSEIISTYCKVPKHVITELNGNIVPAENWAQTSLKEGDVLELVSFVGGG